MLRGDRPLGVSCPLQVFSEVGIPCYQVTTNDIIAVMSLTYLEIPNLKIKANQIG